MREVRAEEIVNYLGGSMEFEDFFIRSPSSIYSLEENTISFAKEITPELAEQVNSYRHVLIIAPPNTQRMLRVPCVISHNPRLDFAKVLREFFAEPSPKGIESTAVVSKDAQIGEGVYIGHYTVIEGGVSIGRGTIIRDHVVIRENCIIGENCIIKSNTVIGEEGFGFEFESDGRPIRIPHFGRVIIGNEVEIGALNVIARGTLEDTLIKDRVKTDDHVFIAHNVVIEEDTVIIAGSEISGSVHIGKGAWIAPQATIINKVKIGDRALVGIGAVVTKSVKANTIVVGNPAKPLRRRFVEANR